MRAITISSVKPINGVELEAELLAASVPVVPQGVSITGTDLIIVLDVSPSDSSYDATVESVYDAHTPPADLTADEVSQARLATYVDPGAVRLDRLSGDVLAFIAAMGG